MTTKEGSALAVSAASTLASWFALANEVAQFLAAVTAIISASVATYYYIKRHRRETGQHQHGPK